MGTLVHNQTIEIQNKKTDLAQIYCDILYTTPRQSDTVLHYMNFIILKKGILLYITYAEVL